MLNPDPHLLALLDGLASAKAFPEPTETVEIRQTHISVVFLTGDRAYKLKKPVDLGFVDYSTVDKRKELCRAEVELNRRLAPSVYIGVRPVVSQDGGFRIGSPADDGESVVDWVVEMRRLADHDNFLEHLHAGRLQAGWLEQLGRDMAEFHSRAERNAALPFGSVDIVTQNALDNFEQSRSQVGKTVHPVVFDALRLRTEETLSRHKGLIAERDANGTTCDTHGDLRLEHVYRCDGELVVVDCIEFNEAFRHADPVADAAFLAMDLRVRWETQLASTFVDAYFEASEFGGRDLLDFYVAYRSAVRAKVHGMTAMKPEVDEATRERASYKSRAHWLFALSTLSVPVERPALVLLAGLPGTGKSTLARYASDELGFDVIDSDVVRKELAGLEPHGGEEGELGGGIYTPEWTQRTYQTCLDRASDALFEGRRVLVEATFRAKHWREEFLHAAQARGVTAVMVECTLPPDEARRRLDARCGDVSDAGRAVHEHLAASWEPSSIWLDRWRRDIETTSRAEARRQFRDVLGEFGLLSVEV